MNKTSKDWIMIAYLIGGALAACVILGLSIGDGVRHRRPIAYRVGPSKTEVQEMVVVNPNVDSYNAALEASAKTGKPLVLRFTASWCGPCKKMERDVWSNAEVQELLRSKFVYYTVDVDREPKIVQQYSVRGVPHYKIIRKDGKVIAGGPDDRKKVIANLNGSLN